MINKNILIMAFLSSFIIIEGMEHYFEGAYGKELTHMMAAKDSLEDYKYTGYVPNSMVVPDLDRNKKILISKAPALLVPGMVEDSFVTDIIENRKIDRENDLVDLLYPDNLIVYESPEYGRWSLSNVLRMNKGTSFGPLEAYALLYHLHKIVNMHGIKDITLYPKCRGATTWVYAVDRLLRNSEPENRKIVEAFNMGPNDCADILHAIKRIILECPMQTVDDSVGLITNKICSMVQKVSHNYKPTLSDTILIENENTPLRIPYLGENYLSRMGSSFILNTFLPLLTSYNPEQKKPVEMLAGLQGLKHVAPQTQLFMTAKAADEFIGSDPARIEHYFLQLPVIDSNKYLVASEATSHDSIENHCEVSFNTQLAWHSFLQRAGASYYFLPHLLEKGEKIVDKARDRQRTVGMQRYLVESYNQK